MKHNRTLVSGLAEFSPILIDRVVEVSPPQVGGTTENRPDSIDGIAEISPAAIGGCAEVGLILIRGVTEISPAPVGRAAEINGFRVVRVCEVYGVEENTSREIIFKIRPRPWSVFIWFLQAAVNFFNNVQANVCLRF